ncbi:carboxylesterase/lipase family protein [Oceanithermus sp.]
MAASGRNLLVGLLAWLLLLAPAQEAAVRLHLPGGWVEGRLEGRVMSFKGITYAHAERWREPELVQSWEGVLPAYDYGPICPQRGDITVRLGRLLDPNYVPAASEDCLNLNVWVPAADPPAEGWPVMVFVHGGSFTGGSGSEPIYDGSRLAEQGAVVVTINYRLGALGFLALPALAAEDPHGSTGNYGLLDQLAAFRWVRQQVSGFGGNPANVTAFGESAGSMSLCSLLASPLAEGAFDRAILESGGCNYVLGKEEAYARAREMAGEVGCALDDLDCWRRAPLEKLVDLSRSKDTDFEKEPFKPVVDGYVLMEPPEQALAAGRGLKVPLIVGANADEYRLDLTAVADRSKFSWEGFEKLVREKEGERTPLVLRHYRGCFGDALEAYYAYMTERVLLCPTYRAGYLMKDRAPVYGYLFEYKSPHWYGMGSAHGFELPFVFDTRRTWPFWELFITEPTFERTASLSRAMQQAWVGFARGEAPRAGMAPLPRLGSGWLLGFDLSWGWRPDVWRQRCALWGADKYQ